MVSTVFVISQAFMPDPAAVERHPHDDPGISCPRHGFWNGVHVRQSTLSHSGTSSLTARLLAQALFIIRATVRGLLTRGLARVVVSTSSLFADSGESLISLVRRVPLVWWVMNLNPDQVDASYIAHPRALAVRHDLMEQAGLPTDMGATNPLRSPRGL